MTNIIAIGKKLTKKSTKTLTKKLTKKLTYKQWRDSNAQKLEILMTREPCITPKLFFNIDHSELEYSYKRFPLEKLAHAKS